MLSQHVVMACVDVKADQGEHFTAERQVTFSSKNFKERCGEFDIGCGEFLKIKSVVNFFEAAIDELKKFQNYFRKISSRRLCHRLAHF